MPKVVEKAEVEYQIKKTVALRSEIIKRLVLTFCLTPQDPAEFVKTGPGVRPVRRPALGIEVVRRPIPTPVVLLEAIDIDGEQIFCAPGFSPECPKPVIGCDIKHSLPGETEIVYPQLLGNMVVVDKAIDESHIWQHI